MQLTANGIAIEAEDLGPPDGTPLLLVNGYTSQLLNWPPMFIKGFQDNGFRVIRYDNRDVGLSQKFSGAPSAAEVIKTVREGATPALPYTLSDMAADGIGVLDALGIDRAHVLGVSMGGMIVQLMAIEHPERLLSMTSIMSSTGNPDLPPADPEAIKALTSRPPSEERSDVIAHRLKTRRVIQSPAYPRTEQDLLALIEADYDRSYYPDGAPRQYAAILGDGSRVDRLRRVTVPSLVVHGEDDPLVPVEGGKDTAASIPGATLKLFKGMGHDLPWELCAEMVALVSDHARRAATGPALA